MSGYQTSNYSDGNNFSPFNKPVDGGEGEAAERQTNAPSAE
jgi:hypothetical protein